MPEISLFLGIRITMYYDEFVLAWAEMHKDELMQNWELARDEKPLEPIAPLM